MKVSPEVKKIADKYCDESGGPPRKKEPFFGIDFAGSEERTVYWIDDCSWIEFLPPMSFDGYYIKFLTTKKAKPKKEKRPEKPWTQFNPTPKNPKRGRR